MIYSKRDVHRLKRVFILMPTLPRYRNRFFERLEVAIGARSDLFVVHGQAPIDKVVFCEETDTFNSISLRSIKVNILGYKLEWQVGLLRLIMSYRPDVVVFLFNPGIISYWLSVLLCRLRRTPYVFWASGYDRPEVTGWRKRFRDTIRSYFTRGAYSHICYGSGYASRLKSIGIPQEKIFVAQNTIDIDEVISGQHLFNKNRSRRLLGLKPDSTIFLYVGALIRSKNLEKTILAISRLRSAGYDASFVIVGGGNIAPELSDLVCREGLNGQVVLTGPIFGQAVIDYFVSADAFLLAGTGGLAVNEAMAYSLPIIATVGDGTIPDLVENNRNGILMHDVSVDKIEAACKDFLGRSQGERERMGAESLRIVREKASLSRMVDGFVGAIKLVCE